MWQTAYDKYRKEKIMLPKLLRSTLFLSIARWAVPRIWAYIKKRRAIK
jgi:hypothetical protein